MMVYCRDRSQKLPRKHKRVFKPATHVVRSSPHMGPSHKEKPSVFERRCVGGVWHTRDKDRDEQEALRILDEIS